MKHVPGGSGNPTRAPDTTLQDPSHNLEIRRNILDEKINKFDEDLAKLRETINLTGPGIIQETAKKRALQILKRKKLYEIQREQLTQQQFDLERVSFALESAHETMITFQVLESTQNVLQNQMQSQQLDVKEINRMCEDQEDLIDHRQEVGETLEQSYDVLEAMGELEDLEAEMEDDFGALETGKVPSYLLTPPEAVLPSVPVIIRQNKAPQEKQEQEQDVYEIPAIPETI